MKTELEKLWLTVEATARVRDGLRDAILKRFSYSASVFEPLELTASEQYLLELAERQLQDVIDAHRFAYTKWLVSRDCSANDPDPVRDRSSDCPVANS